MSDPRKVNVSQLRPGPIRHDTLPRELLNQISVVHRVVGPLLNLTLEEFEVGFMRDAHPEREVAVWTRIAGAWLKYQEQFIGKEVLPVPDQKTLLGALIQISTGIEDPADLQVPPDVGARLLACYRCSR